MSAASDTMPAPRYRRWNDRPDHSVRTPALLRHLLFQYVTIFYDEIDGSHQGCEGVLTSVQWSADPWRPSEIWLDLDWGMSVLLSSITDIRIAALCDFHAVNQQHPIVDEL